MNTILGYTIIEIGQFVAAVYGVASLVARITPTKADDAIVSTVGRFLNLLFLKSNIVIDKNQAAGPGENS